MIEVRALGSEQPRVCDGCAGPLKSYASFRIRIGSTVSFVCGECAALVTNRLLLLRTGT